MIEPIGQVVARPNQSSVPSLVNMDAQSLVFDDANLFEWSKFSGYDRYETGTRVNYGGQASMTFANGAFANALLGQSVQIAGVNSYSTADAANVGLSWVWTRAPPILSGGSLSRPTRKSPLSPRVGSTRIRWRRGASISGPRGGSIR